CIFGSDLIASIAFLALSRSWRVLMTICINAEPHYANPCTDAFSLSSGCEIHIDIDHMFLYS
ncbi:MAG: hypothetical protein ACXV8Q_19730, partial [Methylobacter sp.]